MADLPTDSASPEQAQASQSRPTMAVKVYAPFQIYFDGEAYSISAVNRVGPFDILPHHHNFISILDPCIVKVQTVAEGLKTVKISRALMHVKADRVVVFVDV